MKIYRYSDALYRQALEGEQEEIKGVGATGRVWPVYPDEATKEREEVEEVFHLGGGELNDESWAGYLYNYDGPPEWAYNDFPGVYDGGDDNYQYKTVIVTGGGYLPTPPDVLTDENGVEWEHVRYYMSSGETECGICGSGVGDYFAEQFYEAYGREPGPGDECGLCEHKFEDMPGYVYVGESYEAVYRTRNSNIWPEDY